MLEKNNPKRCKRPWKPEEEVAFISCLKQIVIDGWRCENGFRSNYLLELESQMRLKLPHAGLKADPHISSKFKMWKRDYCAVYDFLSKSGSSGFNPITKKVDATEKLWSELMEHDHEKYNKLKDKSFPFYEDWVEIFGKDRATGENVVAANELSEPDETENSVQPEDTPWSFSASTNFDIDESPESARKTTPKLGKRKTTEDDFLITRLDAICESTNQTIITAAGMVSAEGDDRKRATSIIGQMNLTPLERIKVCSHLLNDPASVDCFLSMTDDEQMDLVAAVLVTL